MCAFRCANEPSEIDKEAFVILPYLKIAIFKRKIDLK